MLAVLHQISSVAEDEWRCDRHGGGNPTSGAVLGIRGSEVGVKPAPCSVPGPGAPWSLKISCGSLSEPSGAGLPSACGETPSPPCLTAAFLCGFEEGSLREVLIDFAVQVWELHASYETHRNHQPTLASL